MAVCSRVPLAGSQPPGSGEVYVLVAGKPGNGKSTALNNVFGVQLETGVTSRSVTKESSVTSVTKNKIALTVVDTPGLGALDIKKEEVTQKIADTLNGRPYILLYCLSVSPNCRLTELDETIARNLQDTLGSVVWDNCVLLLTFSDMARSDEFKSAVKAYKKYIRCVADGFCSILTKIGSSDVTVSTVFDYDSNAILDHARTSREIMAFPIGKSVSGGRTANVMPNVIGPDKYWTDIVFVEIMRMADETSRMSLFALKYGVQETDAGAPSVMVSGTIRCNRYTDGSVATNEDGTTNESGANNEIIASPQEETDRGNVFSPFDWCKGELFCNQHAYLPKMSGTTPAVQEDSP